MTVSLKGKRVTIRDVGRHALVSHQTVSRVINGGLSIAPATRARVERAIAELGFRPNPIARGLASRKTYTVGLVKISPKRITVAFRSPEIAERLRQFVEWLRKHYAVRVTDEEFNDLTDKCQDNLDYLFGPRPAG